jgi:hypothetical protein
METGIFFFFFPFFFFFFFFTLLLDFLNDLYIRARKVTSFVGGIICAKPPFAVLILERLTCNGLSAFEGQVVITDAFKLVECFDFEGCNTWMEFKDKQRMLDDERKRLSM